MYLTVVYFQAEEFTSGKASNTTNASLECQSYISHLLSVNEVTC